MDKDISRGKKYDLWSQIIMGFIWWDLYDGIHMMILMINEDVDSGVERGTGGWIF